MIKCEFEHGAKAKLRHVTSDTIMVTDGKILMAKRVETDVEGGKWCLPGGYMERDENIYETAIRETKEETGWDVTDQVLIAIATGPNSPGDDRQNVKFVFTARPVAETGKADHESTERRWFPLDQLPAPEQIAFDHAYFIGLYLKIQSHPQPLPIIS